MKQATDQPDWDALRQDFPTLDKYAYLDIARKAILPRQVEAYFSEWLQDIYDEAGSQAFSMDMVEQCRTTVAEVFGAPAKQLALVKNTSEGINIVAQGFPWRSGDNVVISEFEHENNTLPWRHLRSRGIEVRLAEPDQQGRITVEQYDTVVDARTRIIGAAWVAYGNGYRADLRALSAYCRDRDIRLVVDGIQAVGILGTPIAELGADVLVSGGHKAMFSLAGAGFMYATQEMTEMLTPPYAAKYSFTSNDRTQPSPELAHDAHRFEYGNPNFVGHWVQRRSAEYLRGIGLANIEARVRKLTTYLMDEAEIRQLRLRTPRSWHERAGIVSIDIGNDATSTVERLRESGVVVSAKDGHLRAALHFYNNYEDVDRLLEGIRVA